MKQIIAHGGAGFASSRRDLKIERYILEQSQVEHPKICFLPQATAESNDYIVKFYETFLELGAVPTWISLFGRVEESWKEKLLQQDIIYVGGGNTRSMLALWREWGLDKLLVKAYEKGILLSGISAGAICWFEQSVTDSVWPLGSLQGLNIIPGSCCPHYDSEAERRPAFLSKVQSHELLPGYGLQDYTAAHFIEGQLKCIVTADPQKTGFYVTPKDEKKLDAIVL